MNPDRPLTGRTALITGAGRGFGAACAQALAALGSNIIATYRSDHGAAHDLAERLRARYAVTVQTLPLDLAAPDSIGTLVASAETTTGGIDILIPTAAAPYPQVALRDLTADNLTAKLGQDLGTVHQLVTATAPRMVEHGYGRIVLIGSLHADGPSAPGMTANGVSKAALAAYVGYAADELTGPGVTINIVHPGYIATQASSHLPPAIPAILTALTPAGRVGTPDDIGGIISLLARPEAAFLNGAAIPVSGGLNHPVSLRRLAHRP